MIKTKKQVIYSILLFFCANSSLLSDEYKGIKEETLPSGGTVKVIAPLLVMKFPNEDTALRLRYITECDIENKECLKKEADGIWELFRINVENGGFKTAIMAAYKPWEGSYQNNKHKGYMFRLEKQNNNQWVYANDID